MREAHPTGVGQIFLRRAARTGDQPVAPTNSDYFFAPFALFAVDYLIPNLF
jgi:hypothetical protein